MKDNLNKNVPDKSENPEFLIAAVIKSVCHMCGGDINIHTPDCTSYIYGIQYGRQTVL